MLFRRYNPRDFIPHKNIPLVREETMRDPVKGKAIFQEISSQAQAWGELIPDVLSRSEQMQSFFEGIDHIIFSGCGSGLNAARFGASLLRMKCKLTTQSAPAIDLTLFPEMIPTSGNTTGVLLSRSGRTTEIVQALEMLQGRGVPVFGITCTQDSPLAKGADLTLILNAVQEKAVTTTRSFTGMILSLQLLAGTLAQDRDYLESLKRLPGACTAILEKAESLGKEIGNRTDLVRYAFVAHGPNLGLMHECQLKIKETTLLPVDAYPMLDFRHGPQATVSSDMLLVACIHQRDQEYAADFLQDMRALGAVTWALCDRATEDLRAHSDYLFEFQSGEQELSLGALYMPAVQYLAYYRSLSLDLDPDRPRNLSYWIDTSK